MTKIELADLAKISLNLLPPTIREELMARDDIRVKYGLSSQRVFSLKKFNVEFDRTPLLAAIRVIVSGSSDFAEVIDIRGDTWRVHLKSVDDNSIISFVAPDKNISILNKYWSFHPDQIHRLEQLELEAKRFNLSALRVDYWKQILQSRPLFDDEFEALQSDLKFSPLGMLQNYITVFTDETESSEFEFPPYPWYYESLVGQWNGEVDILTFAANSATRHLHELPVFHEAEGLKLLTSTCAHSSISEGFSVVNLNPESLKEFIEWLISFGDITAMVGAVEIFLNQFEHLADIEQSIRMLCLRLRNLLQKESVDDDNYGRFGLHSSLFMLTTHEMARTAIFRDKPPFWRRLAAFSHASLIERAVLSVASDTKPFVKWAYNAGGSLFQLQTFVDMRLEPRWLPEYMNPNQVRNDIIGRIIIAAHKNESKMSAEFSQIFTGTDSNSFRALFKVECAFVGPLEGNISSPSSVPEDFNRELEAAVNASTLEVDSFGKLVFASKIWTVTEQQAHIAADALKHAQYRLRNLGDPSKLLSLLDGLASVAASTRSIELARGVKVLSRVVRRNHSGLFDPGQEFRFIMITAAAHQELDEWATFIGEWLLELAYDMTSQDSAAQMLWSVRQLQRIEPALIITTAKADAVLNALANRN